MANFFFCFRLFRLDALKCIACFTFNLLKNPFRRRCERIYFIQSLSCWIDESCGLRTSYTHLMTMANSKVNVFRNKKSAKRFNRMFIFNLFLFLWKKKIYNGKLATRICRHQRDLMISTSWYMKNINIRSHFASCMLCVVCMLFVIYIISTIVDCLWKKVNSS